MHDSDHSHHHHDHHGHHHHDHGHEDGSGQMSLEEKAVRLLEHWIAHNDDHGANYSQWADKLRQHGHIGAAEALDRVGELTERISRLFRQAKDELSGSGS